MRLLAGALATLALGGLPATASADVRFRSPTGNIHCVMSADGVRCDIRAKTWRAPRPTGCRLDWGQGLRVARRGSRGRVVCAGDTVLSLGRRVLRYGRRARLGGMTCVSRRRGVTCTNARGHGFRIARERYRLF